VDWRNRPATKGRHGGMLAASFVLGKRPDLICLAFEIIVRWIGVGREGKLKGRE
jgi:hypothetical protein